MFIVVSGGGGGGGRHFNIFECFFNNIIFGSAGVSSASVVHHCFGTDFSSA